MSEYEDERLHKKPSIQVADAGPNTRQSDRKPAPGEGGLKKSANVLISDGNLGTNDAMVASLDAAIVHARSAAKGIEKKIDHNLEDASPSIKWEPIAQDLMNAFGDIDRVVAEVDIYREAGSWRSRDSKVVEGMGRLAASLSVLEQVRTKVQKELDEWVSKSTLGYVRQTAGQARDRIERYFRSIGAPVTTTAPGVPAASEDVLFDRRSG